MLTSKEHSAVGARAQQGRSARETPMNAHKRMLSKLWESRHHAAVHTAAQLTIYGASAVAKFWDRFGMKTFPFIHSHRLKQNENQSSEL